MLPSRQTVKLNKVFSSIIYLCFPIFIHYFFSSKIWSLTKNFIVNLRIGELVRILWEYFILLIRKLLTPLRYLTSTWSDLISLFFIRKGKWTPNWFVNTYYTTHHQFRLSTCSISHLLIHSLIPSRYSFSIYCVSLRFMLFHDFMMLKKEEHASTCWTRGSEVRLEVFLLDRIRIAINVNI